MLHKQPASDKQTRQTRGVTVRKSVAVVFCLILTVVGTVSIQPKPAHAILGIGDISITAGDIPATIFRVLDKIWAVTQENLLQLAQIGVMNAIDRYVQQFAYEAALQVATGSPGQDSLIFDKPLLEGLKDVGDAAVGDYLDSLSKDLFGHSLCEPVGVGGDNFKLQLTFFLEKANKPPQPKCNLTKIWQDGVLGTASNFQTLGQNLSNLQLEDVVKFSDYFTPRQNQIGTLLTTQQEVKEIKLRAKKEEEFQRQVGEGFKDVTSPIAERIKTPASKVKSTLDTVEQTAADKSVPDKPTEGSVFLRILARGLTTFSRTFLGEWTKQLFQKGLTVPPTGPTDSRNIATAGGVSEARKFFTELIRPDFSTNVSVDVSSELANCPADENAQRWNNCRFNSSVKIAIDQQLSLQEAIDQGLIEGSAVFGYDRQIDQPPDWDKGFPLASLKVMRTYRIVPESWVNAAEYIRDVQVDNSVAGADHGGKGRWTIQELMDCYEDQDPDLKNDNRYPVQCRRDPSASCTNVNTDGAECVNPFYHLVNPDWVLKAPATRCYREGPGPEIVYEEVIEVPQQTTFDTITPEYSIETRRIISRADWCADRQSCIQEDDEGNCLFYGQCVRERPTWNFSASTCPAQFNTCLSVSLQEGSYSQYGGSAGDASRSYLTNTMVTCSAGDVGCGWYSTSRDGSTTTLLWEGNTNLTTGFTVNNIPDRVYLDSDAATCSPVDAGCTALYKLSNMTAAGATDYDKILATIAQVQGSSPYQSYDDFADVQTVYLKKPPAYLGCDTATPHPDCEQYAPLCSLDELGCRYYEPINGDPRIPGIYTPGIGTGDECSAECVGFATYTYTPSWFEDAADGVLDNREGGVVETFDIVPSTGQQCSQPGCERFTNLDDVAQGGEGIEFYTKVRQCVTPGASGTKTYYTWEGSEASGFQLKRWVMLANGGSEPCTEVEPGNPTNCTRGGSAPTCDPDVDPTCREFFDDGGNVYYEYIDLVIYASDDCHPLRRSIDNTVYYGIPRLSQQCQAENVDCREYKGAGANNIQVYFVDEFEAASQGDVDDITGGWTGGVLSNESLEVTGHSLSVSSNITKQLEVPLTQGKFYTLSFIAKGSGTLSSELSDEADQDAFSDVTLTDEWQLYQIGPIQLSLVPTGSVELIISFNGYIDNIVFKQSTDNFLLKKNSWNQPLADQCLAENAFNCQGYIEESSTQTVYLTGFTNPSTLGSGLCEDKFVGCTAFVDTHNLTRPTSDHANPSVLTQWNYDNDDPALPTTLLDNIDVPADSVIFIVDRPEHRCSASEQGCQFLGQPVFDRQQDEDISFPSIAGCPGPNCDQPLVVDFNNVPLINNPDDYDTALCQSEQLFCSEFVTADDSSVYLIDPGNRTCEYRENVLTGTGVVTGWFKKDTNEVCDTTDQVWGTADPLIPLQPLPSTATDTVPVVYTDWVGSCGDAHDTCSQLVDYDPSSETYLEAFYVIHDELEDDIAACEENFVVDRSAGCRLFADTSNFGTKPALYSATAYDPTLSVDGANPVSNVDPLQNSTNVIVQVDPDRVCDQFLHCASSLVAASQGSASADSAARQGRERPICLGIGLCSSVDSSGNCADGAADLLAFNDTPQEQLAFNTTPSDDPLSYTTVDQTQWATGLTDWGMIWDNGSVDALFSYHLMSEIGSPITLPNSGFEDPRNFGHRYSSWPDGAYVSPPDPVPILQENVRIVTRTGGINPYAGERMLSMELGEDPNTGTPRDSYVTTAALPASPDLEMAIAFNVNLDALIQPQQNVCTAGHINQIGQSCTSNADCNVGSSVCTDTGVGAGYCVRHWGGVYPLCTDPILDCNGVSCVTWQCAADRTITCNPNNGISGNPACPGTGVCASTGGSISGGSICTSGDSSKINQSCNANPDCAATSGTCEPVGSILEVQILDADTNNVVVGPFQVSVDRDLGGWQTITMPFIIPDSIGVEDFRVQLYASDPGLADPVRGSIQIDNLEVRSGLKINTTKVVAPSCRLFARTEALACDDVDRSNVSGDTLKTHKGWRGYCVETVPDQPSVCMNWWPVDVVQGDVNFFGAGEVVDLDVANNLYYCVHAVGDTGNSSLPDKKYTYLSPTVLTCTDDGTSGTVPVAGADIYDYEIGAIYVEWLGSSNYCRSGWPFGGQKHQLYPIESDQNLWRYNSGDLWCDRDGCTGYEVRANIDPVTRKLTNFTWTTRDNQGPNAGGTFRFGVTLKDVCQTIVRVNTTEGAHTPWLQRYENGHDNLLHDIDSDVPLHGAVASPSNVYLPYADAEDNPWLGSPLLVMGSDETFYCGASGIAQSCARAGTPYSTQSATAGDYTACVIGTTGEIGISCSDNNQCANSEEPQSIGLCAGYVGNDTNTTPYAMNHGIQKLSQLFAKSYDIYGWDYDARKYVKCDPSSPADMPITCLVPVESGSLSVEIPGGTYIDGHASSRTANWHIMGDYDITGCGWQAGEGTGYPTAFIYNNTFVCSGIDVRREGHAPEVTTLKLNDRSGGVINAYSGQFLSMSFYPNIDENRQPMKGMKIDWGDGTPFKPNQDLTNLAGQGLPIQKYVFVHQYICGPDADSEKDSCNSLPAGERTNCWDTDTDECVFTPRIQLKDNWGWCTADYEYDNSGSSPSYTKLNEGIYQCSRDEAWTQFNGEVRLKKGNFGGDLLACTVSTNPTVTRAGNTITVTKTTPANAAPVSITVTQGYGTFSPDPPNLSSGSHPFITTPYWIPRDEEFAYSVRDTLSNVSSCFTNLHIDPTIPTCTLTGPPVTITEGTNVALSWTADYATNGQITGDGPTVTISSITPPNGSGSTTVTPTSGGDFTLTASNDYGDSGTCTHTVTVRPVAPSALAASAPVWNQVDLTWSDNSAIEQDMILERSQDGGSSWPVRITLSANATSYTDTSVLGNATYTYRISARYSGVSSSYSNTVSVTTPPPPPAQCTLTANPANIVTGNTANLDWTVNIASSASISPTVGSLSFTAPSGSGSETVSPGVTTVYTLDVAGINGGAPATCTATVNVVTTQCTQGNNTLIGNACAIAADCEIPNDGVCTLYPIRDGYCKSGPPHDFCGPTENCLGGDVCIDFTCSISGNACNPNGSCPVGEGTCQSGGAIPLGNGTCTAGLNTTIGNSCVFNADCASSGKGVCS